MVDQKKAPKVKKEKKERPPKQYASKVPPLKDDGGNLFKLKPTDFPNSKEGKAAWCDYQILRWTAKKDQVLKFGDANAKKLNKLEKLRKQLAELEAELSTQAK